MAYLQQEVEANDKIELDPSRNDFPVTLHDPCNITRSMGIIQPQRNILKKICPQFREMTPHGVDNYCCGGGGGTVSIDEIREFRTGPLGKRKADQIRATGAKIVISARFHRLRSTRP